MRRRSKRNLDGTLNRFRAPRQRGLWPDKIMTEARDANDGVRDLLARRGDRFTEAFQADKFGYGLIPIGPERCLVSRDVVRHYSRVRGSRQTATGVENHRSPLDCSRSQGDSDGDGITFVISTLLRGFCSSAETDRNAPNVGV
jgi:hypothetical protein